MPEPNYAVELSPPDIEPYRSGNTGFDYVTTFDSGFAGPDFDAHPRQRIIQVTEAVTITGDHFEFAQDFRGLEVLSPKGTLIGRDNGREVRTPYDNCVLIMPSRRLAKGQTAVRLGRFVS